MKYGDLRDFIRDLETSGDLRRIRASLDPVIEVTEICQRTLDWKDVLWAMTTRMDPARDTIGLMQINLISKGADGSWCSPVAISILSNNRR